MSCLFADLQIVSRHTVVLQLHHSWTLETKGVAEGGCDVYEYIWECSILNNKHLKLIHFALDTSLITYYYWNNCFENRYTRLSFERFTSTFTPTRQMLKTDVFYPLSQISSYLSPDFHRVLRSKFFIVCSTFIDAIYLHWVTPPFVMSPHQFVWLKDIFRQR